MSLESGEFLKVGRESEKSYPRTSEFRHTREERLKEKPKPEINDRMNE